MKLKQRIKLAWMVLTKGYELPESKGDLTLILVDPDGATISEKLGMSKERLNYLSDEIKKSMRRHEEIQYPLLEMSSKCKHVNETVFVSYVIGRMMEQSRSPLGMIFGPFRL